MSILPLPEKQRKTLIKRILEQATAAAITLDAPFGNPDTLVTPAVRQAMGNLSHSRLANTTFSGVHERMITPDTKVTSRHRLIVLRAGFMLAVDVSVFGG